MTFPCTVSAVPCQTCDGEEPIPCGEVTNTQCPFPINGKDTYVCVQSPEEKRNGRLQGTCVQTAYIHRNSTHKNILVWNGTWYKLG